MSRTKLLILLLVLGAIIFLVNCGGSGDVDKACNNLWDMMMKDIAGEEGKTEYLEECKNELKEEAASIVNCIANAKTAEDLEKCE
jgi:hypothetical protein